MTYDFDRVTDRTGTSCIKYDFEKERKGRTDLLPLWVADMDFPLPDEILDVLKKRLAHGIFGYTDPRPDYTRALQNWFRSRHGWEIGDDWNTVTPGVVYGISCAIRAFTREGEAVLIQPPVYYPFGECIRLNRRRQVNNQLVLRDGHYEIDFADFEKKIVENDVKLFLLCNPHNPGGRVWTEEELRRLGDICLAHHVIVFADEIHCDFTFPGYTYRPFAGISEEYAAVSIIGTSASKTFNIAGLQTANILVPDPGLRRRFREENAAAGYSQGSVFGLTATQAAYEKGGPWFDSLLEYLTGNLDFVRRFLEERIPKIRLIEPEGTYLLWLDCRGLGLSHEKLEDLITDRAHLWLDPGIIFGEETALFERINIATQRSVLEKALSQLEAAVRGL